MELSIVGRNRDETIVALASGPGVAALAVVRISGTSAHAIAARLVPGRLPNARMIALRTIRGLDGEVLDEATVIRYDAPSSYTGEDCVEFICHGGWITPARIVKGIVEAGARPALAGEFTRRAVLNGRLDLLQAEAVDDLIRAESSGSAAQALRQLDGALSERILSIREQILCLEALVAYEIDFPDESDESIDGEQIHKATRDVITSMDQLLITRFVGELVRHGAVVVIVGPPNVGKSSLFNALLGRRRSLVTEVPGTTRDAIEAVLDVTPVALRLVDTAGLRETSDAVERLGVAVSREYVESAQIVLVCGDSLETLVAAVGDVRGAARGRMLFVRTKSDLVSEEESWPMMNVIPVSAKTGDGLERLIREVSTVIAEEREFPGFDSPVITQARHREVLLRARSELVAFESARRVGTIPVTVSAVHLRESVRVLEELIGLVDVDEVLGKLFSTFCVGK